MARSKFTALFVSVILFFGLSFALAQDVKKAEAPKAAPAVKAEVDPIEAALEKAGEPDAVVASIPHLLVFEGDRTDAVRFQSQLLYRSGSVGWVIRALGHLKGDVVQITNEDNEPISYTYPDGTVAHFVTVFVAGDVNSPAAKVGFSRYSANSLTPIAQPVFSFGLPTDGVPNENTFSAPNEATFGWLQKVSVKGQVAFSDEDSEKAAFLKPYVAKIAEQYGIPTQAEDKNGWINRPFPKKKKAPAAAAAPKAKAAAQAGAKDAK